MAALAAMIILPRKRYAEPRTACGMILSIFLPHEIIA
jgi:hypothetical protein